MKKTNKKSGFTLVELMVVAIIVAILAAVAVPLMSGNTERAAATEAQAACGTIATAQRLARVETGSYQAGDVFDLPGLNAGDLNGTYFSDNSYSMALNGNGFVITATSRGNQNIPSAIRNKTVVMTVNGQGRASWSGTLLGDAE